MQSLFNNHYPGITNDQKMHGKNSVKLNAIQGSAKKKNHYHVAQN